MHQAPWWSLFWNCLLILWLLKHFSSSRRISFTLLYSVSKLSQYEGPCFFTLWFPRCYFNLKITHNYQSWCTFVSFFIKPLVVSSRLKRFPCSWSPRTAELSSVAWVCRKMECAAVWSNMFFTLFAHKYKNFNTYIMLPLCLKLWCTWWNRFNQQN